MKKQNKKMCALLLTACSSLLVLGTMMAVKANENPIALAADTSLVYKHYAAVDATKTKGGIREYWVSCKDGSHYFSAPTDGKIEEGTNPLSDVEKSDDRYMMSFDELDALLGDIKGHDPYDDQCAAFKHYTEIYTTSASNAYGEGKVYKAMNTYMYTFSSAISFSDGEWSSKVGHVPSDSYEYASSVSTEKGYAFTMKANSSISEAAYLTFTAFNKVDFNSQGVMYVKAPYSAKIRVATSLGNSSMDVDLSEGWNLIAFDSTSWKAFKNDGGIGFYFDDGITASEGEWAFSGVYGTSDIYSVNKAFDTLPSSDELIPFYRDAAVSAVASYNSLDAMWQEFIDEKDDVTALNAKAASFGDILLASVAGKYKGGETELGSYGLETNVEGLKNAMSFSLSEDVSSLVVDVDLSSAGTAEWNPPASGTDKKSVFYTKNLSSSSVKISLGGVTVVEGTSQSDLGNGWIAHEISNVDMQNIANNAGSATSLSFEFGSISANTCYISNIFAF